MQHADSLINVFCHMDSGRWTEVFRRGEDAAGAPVTPQKSFAPGPAPDVTPEDMEDGFGDRETGEFYVGNANLRRIVDANSIRLKVDVHGQDDERYFSVFDGFAMNNGELQLSAISYRYGTAGDGNLDALDTAVYSDSCTPTVWFAPPGTCDATTNQGPFLTLPLDGSNHRGGSFPWPTLPVELKAVSLKLRADTSDACSDMQNAFAFDGDVLTAIDNTLPQLIGEGDTFTISCKDQSMIIPTRLHHVANLTSSATFSCSLDSGSSTYSMNDVPLLAGNPCMRRCPEGYSLYTRDPAHRLDPFTDRVTCLSPPSSDTALGLVQAAGRCGERDEQLLDFVPAKAFIGDVDTSQRYILNLHLAPSKTSVRNTRDPDVPVSFGVASQPNCLHLQYDANEMPAPPQQSHCRTEESRGDQHPHYICMTNADCRDGAVFHKGFCFTHATLATASNHIYACRPLGASPANFSEDLVNSVVPRLPVAGAIGPLVGAYKRHGVFWAHGGALLPPTAFVGGTYGQDTQECAALSATDATKLEPIDCTDPTPRGVICQTPGYETAGTSYCSVRYDQLRATASGQQLTLQGQNPAAFPTAENDRVRLSCPSGYNLFNVTGLHDTVVWCRGFKLGWTHEPPLPAEFAGRQLDCVLACDLSNIAEAPANSQLTVNDSRIVFHCRTQLTTIDGAFEQATNCDHQTSQLSPAISSMLPCDHCMMPPLVPDEDATYVSNWATELASSRLLDTVVTYRCLPGLTTAGGDTEQNQTCTVDGWVGEVQACSFCAPLELNNTGLSTNASEVQSLGALLQLSCPEGVQSVGGETNTTAICLPSGWQLCPDYVNCTHCAGSPPNVTGLTTITSNWTDGDSELGAVAHYSCAAGLQTLVGLTEQNFTCGDGGWQGELLPCDQCLHPPDGNHPSIASVTTSGNHSLGAAIVFRCVDGLNTTDGSTEITSVCTETGWSHCDQEIHCSCPELRHLPDGTMTWDYDGNNTFGSVVTLTCSSDLATPQGLRTTQTVACGSGGWNDTDVQSCTVCTAAPPPPASGMASTVDWTLGDEAATYQCSDASQLPWGRHSYRLACSPTGWDGCVPECDSCRWPPQPEPGSRISELSIARGGTTRYVCRPGMQDVSGPQERELVCTETGWTGEHALNCDTCIGDPAEPGASQNRTGEVTGKLENALLYICTDSMTTEAGLREQTMKCKASGWSRPPASCDHCPQPPAPENLTQVWDLDANVTGPVPIGTTVTYICTNETVLVSTNNTNQTLSCGAAGWLGELEQCVACAGDIPDPGNGTDALNVTWDGSRRLGAAVLYTCPGGMEQTVTCLNRSWTPAELQPCGEPS